MNFAILALLAGLLATQSTETISNLKKVVGLNPNKRTPVLNLTAAAIAIIFGYILSTTGEAVGVVDEGGAWKALLLSYPATAAWFKGLKVVDKFAGK